MAVADISNPKVTQDYTTLLQGVRDVFVSQAAMHDATGIVGLTAGAIRYSGTNTRFEKFDGTSWNALPVNTSGNAANITGIAAGANGGTGVNNNGKTITLGGNLATVGAFGSTFTMTGTTTVTFPTSGTLLSSAAAVTVAQGGTGATTAATARANLSAVGTSDVIGIAQGGTSASTSTGALAALGALPAAGGNAAGSITFNNSVGVMAKDAGGTVRPLIFCGADNNVYIGTVGGQNIVFRSIANSIIATITEAGDFTAKSATYTSDERLKTNRRPLDESVLDRVADMVNAGYFDWIDGSGTALGLSAQELRSIGLGVVVRADAEGKLSVDYPGLTAVLVHAMLRREKRRHADYERRFAALEAK